MLATAILQVSYNPTCLSTLFALKALYIKCFYIGLHL